MRGTGISVLLCAALLGSAAAPSCAAAAGGADPSHNRTWAVVSGPARDIRFDVLTKADGIPAQPIFQVLQDRRGFVWFTTAIGLIRYDGYQHVVYPGLPMARRQQWADAVPGLLFEDHGGTLWVASETLTRFDPATGKFTPFLNPRPGPARPGIDAITAIHEGSGGWLWVGMSSQTGKEDVNPALYQVDPVKRVSVPHPIGRDITQGAPVNIRAIEEDSRGRIWLGTSIGLIRFDPETGAFQGFPHTHPSAAIEALLPFNGLVWDKTGHLWVHMPAGLERFDPETGVFDRFTAVEFWSMFADPGGRIWLWGGTLGLKLFDPSGPPEQALQTVSFTSPSGQPLTEMLLVGVNADRRGRVWMFPAVSGAVYRHSPGTARLVRYSPSPRSANSLSGGDVWQFVEDEDGSVWIATRFSGLNRFDPRSGTFTQFRHDPGNPRSLISDRIYQICADRSNTLWVSTDRGLGTFDRKTGRYTHLRDARATGGMQTTGILEDRSGRLVVSTISRLEVVDKRTGASTLLSGTGGFVRYEDRQGNLWITVRGGMNKLDRAGNLRFISLREPDTSNPSLTIVSSFHEDASGTLWLATNKGLYEFDPSSERAVPYARREGLPTENVKCMVADDNGSFWLSTTQGISRFDRNARRFYNYDERHGLQVRDFLWAACSRARDGTLYFGGSSGFQAFHPRDLLTPAQEPVVVLTDFLVNGKQAPVVGISSVQLVHGQNGLTFEFAALDAVNPEAIRYRFRLEGLEKNWTEVDSSRRLGRYTEVPEGEYVFRAEASFDGRSWSPKGAALAVTIQPPWWKTWWVVTLGSLLLVGSMLAAYKLRVRALTRHHQKLAVLVDQRTAELASARDQAEAANRAKSAFLANISHELRTPLNAILGFSGLLRESHVSGEQREQVEIINRSGEHLLTLIDDVLDVAKIEAGKHALAIAPFDLDLLIHDVVDMMRVRAHAKNLDLLCVQPPDYPRYVRADASKLRQVLINLLSNAVKFTAMGTVTLRLKSAATEAGGLLLGFEVEDTGIGILPEDQTRIFEPFVQGGQALSQKGTGLGLTITNRFVEMMGGTIGLETEVGRGSRFTVEVPMELAQESEVPELQTGHEQRWVQEPGQPEYRALIVDDSPENAMVLEQLLCHAGFQVRVALNGALAVEQFQQWRPHFIWMDVRMPEMNGMEATRRIRQLDGGREVKIAAMTASAFKSERDAVIAAGMDDFIGKPCRTGEIFSCMARHLGVRFSQHPTAEAVKAKEAGLLLPLALAALPEKLRRNLADAVISLDHQRISSVVDRVKEMDEALAAALSQMADRFAYTAILNAIESSDKVDERQPHPKTV